MGPLDAAVQWTEWRPLELCEGGCVALPSQDALKPKRGLLRTVSGASGYSGKASSRWGLQGKEGGDIPLPLLETLQLQGLIPNLFQD